jgi:hypothetical protein
MTVRPLFLAPLLGLAASASCGRPAVELPPGLVLAADFEGSLRADASGPSDEDRRGSGHTYEPGVEGHALHLDGSGAAVAYELEGGLPLRDAFTLELFFSPDAWRNPYEARAVLETLAAHADAFALALQPDSWLLTARVRAGKEAAEVALVGGVVSAGSWHHAALVLDPASASARLYLDGEVVAEAPVVGRLPLREDEPLTVGVDAEGGTAHAGRIDSLRLWNRALSAEELAERVQQLPGTGS